MSSAIVGSPSRSYTYRTLFPVETHSSAFGSITTNSVLCAPEFQVSTNHTFVDDVFISYRHLDNELLDKEKKGWVDRFHEDFEIILGEELGYEPQIWRDSRLAGDADFS